MSAVSIHLRRLGDTLRVYAQFVNTTGSAAAATSVAWRIYKENDGTAVDSGTMTAIDGTNALGLYYNTATITMSGGNYLDETEYVVRVTGTIDGETPAAIAPFRIGFDGPILARGTADSGSTTTVVDTERTEADTDYWKDQVILFTSGTIKGQARRITAFNAGTDTITFTPVTTQAVGTNTYVIIAASGRQSVDLVSIDGQLTAGNNATLFLKQLNVVNSAGDAVVAQSTGSNGHGMNIAGNGDGHGAFLKSGINAGARALLLDGEGSADYALEVKGAASNNAALFNGGNGSGGQLTIGETTGRVLGLTATSSVPAIDISGGGATQGAVHIQGNTGLTDAPGMTIFGGDGKAGLVVLGGNGSGNAPGAIFTGQGTEPGVDFVGGASGGDGARATGGSGGHGYHGRGGAVNGAGARFAAQAGNAPGLELQGVGASAGLRSVGGAADGDGAVFQAQGSGNAIEALVVTGEPLSQNIEDQLAGTLTPVTIALAVWDELLSVHGNVGSAGLIVRDTFKIARNRLLIDENTNTYTIFDDDGTTPLFVWNLKDANSNPTFSDLFEREPV